MSTDLDAALRGLRAHARQKFAMLGLHPSQHYSAPLVAAVIDGNLSDARWLMHLLTTPRLVERAGPGTWVMPERVHYGARACAEYLPEAQTTLATIGLVRHYARCAAGATLAFGDHGWRPTEGAERAAELAEHALGIWHAHGHGQISHSGGQAVAAPTATAHFEDALPRIRAAIDACDDHSDAVQTALCLIRALLAIGDLDQASHSASDAHTITRDTDDRYQAAALLVHVMADVGGAHVPHGADDDPSCTADAVFAALHAEAARILIFHFASLGADGGRDGCRVLPARSVSFGEV